MSEQITTSTTNNGFEIAHPREVLTANEFKEVVSRYGIEGRDPAERMNNLRNLPAEAVAMFLSDVNRGLQGSEETLIADRTINVGGKPMVSPEHRYDLFVHLIDNIKAAKEISPARAGDALALGTVILHPFEDGNGRTARMMALLFREEYDNAEYESSFDMLSESRDDVRERGGFMINGFIPYFPEGADQSDPATVAAYFDALVTQDSERLYNGPAGQEPLYPSGQ